MNTYHPLQSPHLPDNPSTNYLARDLPNKTSALHSTTTSSTLLPSPSDLLHPYPHSEPVPALALISLPTLIPPSILPLQTQPSQPIYTDNNIAIQPLHPSPSTRQRNATSRPLPTENAKVERRYQATKEGRA